MAMYNSKCPKCGNYLLCIENEELCPKCNSDIISSIGKQYEKEFLEKMKSGGSQCCEKM
jgi:rRNA maturation protein Nop10